MTLHIESFQKDFPSCPLPVSLISGHWGSCTARVISDKTAWNQIVTLTTTPEPGPHEITAVQRVYSQSKLSMADEWTNGFSYLIFTLLIARRVLVNAQKMESFAGRWVCKHDLQFFGSCRALHGEGECQKLKVHSFIRASGPGSAGG